MPAWSACGRLWRLTQFRETPPRSAARRVARHKPVDVSLPAAQCFTFTPRLFLRNMRPVTRFRLGKCYFVRLGWLGDQDLIPCFASPRCVLPINMTDQKSGERVFSILVHDFPV